MRRMTRCGAGVLSLLIRHAALCCGRGWRGSQAAPCRRSHPPSGSSVSHTPHSPLVIQISCQLEKEPKSAHACAAGAHSRYTRLLPRRVIPSCWWPCMRAGERGPRAFGRAESLKQQQQQVGLGEAGRRCCTLPFPGPRHQQQQTATDLRKRKERPLRSHNVRLSLHVASPALVQVPLVRLQLRVQRDDGLRGRGMGLWLQQRSVGDM